MNDKQFTKLSKLVDSEFTIERVHGFKYKAWNPQESKMVINDEWFEGARKLYQVDTDKGTLDLSEGQLGTIFAKSQQNGKSDVIGVTVGVKSNGKTGIDIRYYLNALKQKPVKTQESDDDRYFGYDQDEIGAPMGEY